MPVIFKGGTSGVRFGDFAAPTPFSGVPQPVIDTSCIDSDTGGVYFAGGDIQRPTYYTLNADFMPTCCDPHPENSTDVQQQDISGL